MSFEKNSGLTPGYWEGLLNQLENELNVGWASVSYPLDEKQRMLKQIVTLVHKTVEEAENARARP